ncbi:MAG: hypothetical protein HGA85_08815 [Nanoarchaeota archaeon]|nr:hypothetical protein [Nanoarchaeota archaeon]
MALIYTGVTMTRYNKCIKATPTGYEFNKNRWRVAYPETFITQNIGIAGFYAFARSQRYHDIPIILEGENVIYEGRATLPPDVPFNVDCIWIPSQHLTKKILVGFDLTSEIEIDTQRFCIKAIPEKTLDLILR